MNYLAGLFRTISYVTLFFAGIEIGTKPQTPYLALTLMIVSVLFGSVASGLGSWYWEHKNDPVESER